MGNILQSNDAYGYYKVYMEVRLYWVQPISGTKKNGIKEIYGIVWTIKIMLTHHSD